MLCKAVLPHVFAETRLGGQLPVVWEVVVHLVRPEVGCRTIQVSYIKSNVELLGLVGILLSMHFDPAHLLDGSSDEGLHSGRLHQDIRRGVVLGVRGLPSQDRCARLQKRRRLVLSNTSLLLSCCQWRFRLLWVLVLLNEALPRTIWRFFCLNLLFDDHRLLGLVSEIRHFWHRLITLLDRECLGWIMQGQPAFRRTCGIGCAAILEWLQFSTLERASVQAALRGDRLGLAR